MNNHIQEPYCSYEVSKLLKDKEYRNETLHYYIDVNDKHSNHRTMSTKHIFGANWNSYPSEANSSRVSAPSHALAIEWIRVNFSLVISTKHLPFNQKFGYEVTGKYDPANRGYIKRYDFSHYDSLEKATEAALLYTLKNLI